MTDVFDFGMKEIVVHNELEADFVIDEYEGLDYTLISGSNAGLPKGSCRLTFIKNGIINANTTDKEPPTM